MAKIPINEYIRKFEKENGEIKVKSAEFEKDLNSTRDELNRVNGEFSYLKNKEQEIEQMSESIGTMYMVAMQNAQEIIGEAESLAKEVNQISALRLEAAAKLLREKKHKIYEIAEKCGFSDNSNFSRAFRKLTNMSPSDFRKKYKAE